MHIRISGKQIDIGQALHGHVEARLSQAVEKYFDRPIGANVVFSRDARSIHRCDATVNLATGLQAVAQGQDAEIYAACDQAVTRIEKQLRRHKRRIRNHHQRAIDPIDLIGARSYVVAGQDDEPADTGADEAAPVIIAETRTSIAKLSVGDAVMQMELAHAPLLVFQNEANGRLNVVYQRDDGNVGWIDPEGAGDHASGERPKTHAIRG